LCDLSIEISDSGHRKIPFEAEHDSNQIGSVPTESIRFGSTRVHNGRTNHHEGQKESCQESGEEACEEEEEVVISIRRSLQEQP
jgi:hypothetical protein